MGASARLGDQHANFGALPRRGHHPSACPRLVGRRWRPGCCCPATRSMPRRPGLSGLANRVVPGTPVLPTARDMALHLADAAHGGVPGHQAIVAGRDPPPARRTPSTSNGHRRQPHGFGSRRRRASPRSPSGPNLTSATSVGRSGGTVIDALLHTNGSAAIASRRPPPSRRSRGCGSPKRATTRSSTATPPRRHGTAEIGTAIAWPSPAPDDRRPDRLAAADVSGGRFRLGLGSQAQSPTSNGGSRCRGVGRSGRCVTSSTRCRRSGSRGRSGERPTTKGRTTRHTLMAPFWVPEPTTIPSRVAAGVGPAIAGPGRKRCDGVLLLPVRIPGPTTKTVVLPSSQKGLAASGPTLVRLRRLRPVLLVHGRSGSGARRAPAVTPAARSPSTPRPGPYQPVLDAIAVRSACRRELADLAAGAMGTPWPDLVDGEVLDHFSPSSGGPRTCRTGPGRHLALSFTGRPRTSAGRWPTRAAGRDRRPFRR